MFAVVANLSATYRFTGRRCPAQFLRFDYGNGQIHVDKNGAPWAVIPDVVPDDFMKEIDEFLSDNHKYLFPRSYKPAKTKKTKKTKKNKRK